MHDIVISVTEAEAKVLGRVLYDYWQHLEDSCAILSQWDAVLCCGFEEYTRLREAEKEYAIVEEVLDGICSELSAPARVRRWAKPPQCGTWTLPDPKKEILDYGAYLDDAHSVLAMFYGPESMEGNGEDLLKAFAKATGIKVAVSEKVVRDKPRVTDEHWRYSVAGRTFPSWKAAREAAMRARYRRILAAERP